MYINVDVDEILSDIDTDDLIKELESRNSTPTFEGVERLTEIWQLRRLGKDYQKELDQYIYSVLGKVI